MMQILYTRRVSICGLVMSRCVPRYKTLPKYDKALYKIAIMDARTQKNADHEQELSTHRKSERTAKVGSTACLSLIYAVFLQSERHTFYYLQRRKLDLTLHLESAYYPPDAPTAEFPLTRAERLASLQTFIFRLQALLPLE